MGFRQGRFVPHIIDVEASGFGAESYPIEVGVVLADGRRYCRLIVPQPSWQHWSKEAEDLHGISRQLLLEKGISIYQVCDDLNTLLHGMTVHSDGWVVDYPWLIKLFEAAQTPMKFSVSPLEMVLTEYQMEHWSRVRQKVEQTHLSARHRASSDAAFIQNVFVQTQQHMHATAS